MAKVHPTSGGGGFTPNSTWLWLLRGYRWRLPIKGHGVGRPRGELAWEPSASPLDGAGFGAVFSRWERKLSVVPLPQDLLCCSSCQRALGLAQTDHCGPQKGPNKQPFVGPGAEEWSDKDLAVVPLVRIE